MFATLGPSKSAGDGPNSRPNISLAALSRKYSRTAKYVGTVADKPVAKEASLGIVKWRWVRRSSGFSMITLPDGNQVLADDETRNFFEGTDRPDPSNQSLSRLWREVARVRITDGGMSERKPLGHTVLLDVTDPEEAAQLFERLAIVEPALGLHCMCYGDQALELRDRGDAVIAVLGLHHGVSLRWDEWSTDAELKDGQALLEWLGRHGVHLPSSKG